MNAILFSILAKLVNSDKVAGYVRTLVTAWVTGAALWLGLQIPLLAPLLTPEVQAAVVATVVGLLGGVWSHISKIVSAPTASETEKVVLSAENKGLISPATAATIQEVVPAAKVDDTIK